MMMHQIFSEEEALAIAAAAAQFSGWSQGLARTRELTGTVKQNDELLEHELLGDIGRRMMNNNSVQLNHIPERMHRPKFSRYRKGQHYKLHTDAPWMGATRTDLSCTLWLSGGYAGGELVIEGKPFKGKPGQCLVYECGQKHEVRPVTEGERVCVVTWIQSRIRDSHKRRIVSELRALLRALEGRPEFVDGSKIHSALIRMWME
jgi:PKHD-type hydroxylase